MPHHAAITAMPPSSKSGGNILGLNINVKASPEFWMPVSIDIERRSLRLSLNNEANENPIPRASALCNRTIMKIMWITWRNCEKLLRSIIATINTKKKIEKRWMGLDIFWVILGKYLANRTPIITGIPRMIKTVTNIWKMSISSGLKKVPPDLL